MECEYCNTDKLDDLFECKTCGTIQCVNHVRYEPHEDILFRCCHCLSENLMDVEYG